MKLRSSVKAFSNPFTVKDKGGAAKLVDSVQKSLKPDLDCMDAQPSTKPISAGVRRLLKAIRVDHSAAPSKP